MAGRESAQDKGRRLLTEGRLRVVFVSKESGLIVAECRGDSGEFYSLGYDPRKKQWRCTCDARGRCSHLVALQLALPDDLNAEYQHDQLVLDPEAFKVIHSLADAGVVTPTALDLKADLPYEKGELIAVYFGEMSRHLQWWVGDLLIYAEEHYGEQFAQLAAATGLSEGALQRRMYVCRNVPPKRRRAGLPFSVHMVVASLNAKEQERWLKKAEQGQWSAQELRSRMKAARKDEAPPLLDVEPGDIDEKMLIDAARNLIAHAELAGENVICRREDFARVKAALGEDE